MSVSPDDLVDDIMTSSPRTIRAFLEFRMRCVGCPIAGFHTVRDACREHGVDCDAFMRALVSLLEHDPEKHALGLDPMGGDRFSLATNAERVCAEIMLKQRARA